MFGFLKKFGFTNKIIEGFHIFVCCTYIINVFKREIKTMLKKFSTKVLVIVICLLSMKCMANLKSTQSISPLGIGIVEGLQFPNNNSDVMGLRICLLYGQNINVFGVDVGVFGCSVDGCLLGLEVSGILNIVGAANGAIQVAGIANNCLEDFYGFQVSGIVNNAYGIYGGQIGVLNIAKNVGGLQIGLYNRAETVTGVQIGVINCTAEMDGIQIGVLNIIKNSSCSYLPIVNAHF